MMYENSRFGLAPYCNPSLMDNLDLVNRFQKEVVSVIVKQGWAIDEMLAGIPVEEIEGSIWKGFEDWAAEEIEEDKIEKSGDFYG